MGIWDYTADEVKEKGRVGPGELLVIDTLHGKVWQSSEIDEDLKARHPYKAWLSDNVKRLKPFEDLEDKNLIGQT